MILEHIKQILPKNNRKILVGVSGGPDSLCLVDGLSRLAYPTVVAYFNHQLRPEAEAEAQGVERVAASCNFPFRLGSGDVRQYARAHSLSIEEAARLLRYQFLFEQAQNLNAGAVAVGHNANDQVETILMNLLRGTGLAGLSGMSPFTLPNPWSETIPLVRPLLGVWRKDILAYCQERNLNPIHDASNTDTAFLRNRVRHELLPILENYRAGVSQRLWQTANILAEDQAALQERVEELWNDFPSKRAADYVALDRAKFLNLPTGLQRRLIRRAFRHLRPNFTELSFDVVEEARKLMAHPPQSKEADLAGGVKFSCIGDTAYLAAWNATLPLERWPQMEDSSTLVKLPLPGGIDLPGGWRLSAEFRENSPLGHEQALRDSTPFCVYLDAGKILPPLVIRPRRDGERFSPLGMDGQSTKISDFMVNEKIPRQARPRWPLIISQGEVIWIPGYRLSHMVRVTERTEKVLCLSLERG